MRSLRRDRAGRVIIGSMGRMIGTPARGVSRRWADRQLGRLFPGLGPVRYEAGWHGAIAMTPDHLPRIHILDEGLFTPIGYNGRGITTGTVFGAAIAALLSGAHADSLPLPVSSPAAFRGFRMRERFYDLAFTANQVVRGVTG
jgi:glycine/D-amino acid oxidase-like deaminating enzyme